MGMLFFNWVVSGVMKAKKKIIRAFNASTGKVLWSNGQLLNTNWRITVSEGKLFGAYHERFLHLQEGAKGGLFAFDAATGKELWSQDLGDHSHTNNPAAGKGIVVATAGNPPVLQAFASLSGEALWKLDSSFTPLQVLPLLRPQPVIIVNDMVVAYVVYPSRRFIGSIVAGEFKAFSVSTGETIWSCADCAPKYTSQTSGLTLSKDVIFFTANAQYANVTRFKDFYYLAAVNISSGSQLWNRTTSRKAGWGADTPVTLDGLVLITNNCGVSAIDAVTGASVWNYIVDGGDDGRAFLKASHPVSGKAGLYLMCSGEKLYSVAVERTHASITLVI